MSWQVDAGSVREMGEVGVDAGSVRETGDVEDGRGIRLGNG